VTGRFLFARPHAKINLLPPRRPSHRETIGLSSENIEKRTAFLPRSSWAYEFGTVRPAQQPFGVAPGGVGGPRNLRPPIDENLAGWRAARYCARFRLPIVFGVSIKLNQRGFPGGLTLGGGPSRWGRGALHPPERPSPANAVPAAHELQPLSPQRPSSPDVAFFFSFSLSLCGLRAASPLGLGRARAPSFRNAGARPSLPGPVAGSPPVRQVATGGGQVDG